jgi:hypothetical protein
VVKLRKRVTGSNLADTGRVATHNQPLGLVDSVAGLRRRWGGCEERLRRTRGEVAGAELDATLIDRFAVNTGTIPHGSLRLESIRVGGIGTSSAERTGRGGGPVVVRARERRVHGEGDQQVSREDSGMPGGRG